MTEDPGVNHQIVCLKANPKHLMCPSQNDLQYHFVYILYYTYIYIYLEYTQFPDKPIYVYIYIIYVYIYIICIYIYIIYYSILYIIEYT